VRGDDDSTDAHRKFYDEYNAVLDLPAEYYLDTIKTVFQDFSLVKGTWEVDGQLVRPQDITTTALLTIEGELDDISGAGQTKAAHGLCTGVPKDRQFHYDVAGAGHYGIFSGRRWRDIVYPQVRDFIARFETERVGKARSEGRRAASRARREEDARRRPSPRRRHRPRPARPQRDGLSPGIIATVSPTVPPSRQTATPPAGVASLSLAERIDALLPQTQCTRCGYPDCRAYADAVASGEAKLNQCPPGGAEGIRGSRNCWAGPSCR
jgi:hypothetical protein